MNEKEKVVRKIAKELGIPYDPKLELTEETLLEFSNNKGDDDDE